MGHRPVFGDIADDEGRMILRRELAADGPIPSDYGEQPVWTGHAGLVGDLYTAVYALIDDAKTDHQPLKLYKGSPAAEAPHAIVIEAGTAVLREGLGLFGFIASHSPASTQATPTQVCSGFDTEHQPRVPTVMALRELVGHHGGEDPAALFGRVTGRRHVLSRYRGGSSGFDDEARAFLAAHFARTGIPARLDDVLIFCGGAKGAFIAACATLMCTRVYDQLHHHGGTVLAPRGYYQSLRLIPAIFGGDIVVVDELTPQSVRDWLARTAGQGGRVVYAPLVNNATGQVLDRRTARGIARAVLFHNQEHPADPVHVIADDVYVTSYPDHLSGEQAPTSIASVTGAELGDASLGRMSDWTVAVVSASKAFALPTARVAFATTTSQRLRHGLAHYRTVFSFGRVPQVDEVMSAAAICLTPAAWLADWTRHYQDAAAALVERVAALNHRLGLNAIQVQAPAGGWYVALRLSKALFPPTVTNGVDAAAVALHYAPDQAASGIGMLPGELFGYGLDNGIDNEAFTFRVSLAVHERTLAAFVQRLADMAAVLRGPDGPAVADAALRRARTVADLDTILKHRRY